MSDEIRYTDSPWDDEQERLNKVNLTGVENLELLTTLRNATGRSAKTNFSSPKEKRKYLKIDKQFSAGKIPQGWIDKMVRWAERKNRGRIAIMFPALLSAILNKANMQDWINSQPVSEADKDTLLEKYSDPEAFD